MSERMDAQMERITRYENLIARAASRAVRPYRADGYVNLMNKYGTSKDSSEQYRYVREPTVPDGLLVSMYESDGLFSKIIDAPAEEALKKGFELEGIEDENVKKFYMQALDELDWTETAISSLKWARLFGGSLAVLLVNDGGGLEEPLNWRKIKSIDDIRVYDRSIISPDYESMYFHNPNNPFDTRGSRLGEPEYYDVYSKYGQFRVHESRCLVFRNGILPENTTNSEYELWGIPEYVRIHRQLRDVSVSYGSGPKMLDRSVQPVYKMKDLAAELASEEGENRVLKRLQAIDAARGMMNSIVVDNDGEDYDFRTFTFSGTSDLINTSCDMLSAVTNIPQTVLFGRGADGLNATDETSMENYYNYVERIQQRMLRTNLRYLLSIIFQAGLATGEVEDVPEIVVKFNSLKPLSDSEQADLDLKHAQLDSTKAETIQKYVDMQVLDPYEVRKKLAEDGDYDICTMLDDIDEETLKATYEKMQEQQQATENEKAPAAAPDATKLPQDMDDEAKTEAAVNADGGPGSGNHNHEGRPGKVGGSAPSNGGGASTPTKLDASSASKLRQKMLGGAESEAAAKASEATDGYTGKFAAMNLNKELRKDNPELDSWQKERVGLLDSTMADLPEDVSLMRSAMMPYGKAALGISGNESQKRLEKKLVGKEFTEKAYMSTSYDAEMNNAPWGDIIMNITAKKGTKALVTTNDDEAEVILGRNTNYKVTKVSVQEGGVNGKQIVLDVETTPGTETNFDDARADGGAGSGNWEHEGRPGKVGGSAGSGGSSEKLNSLLSEREHLQAELNECYQKICSADATIRAEAIEEAKNKSARFAELSKEIEENTPKPENTIANMLEREGHPDKDKIINSLPDEWKNKYSAEYEQTYGEAVSAKLTAWSGEEYTELKHDYVLSKAVELTDAKWDKGELYRGMSLHAEDVAQIKKGGTIKMDGLSSWSSNISPAMQFATTEQTPVLLIDKTSGKRNAMSVAAFSGRPWEMEVLYGKDQEFTVRSVSAKEVEHGTSANGSSADFSKRATRKVTVIEVESK